MATIADYNRLLTTETTVEGLPEKWMEVRGKLAPYLSKACRYARYVYREANKSRTMNCYHKEYNDCRVSALVFRKDEDLNPIYWTILKGGEVDTVSVGLEPVRKSLGNLSLEYEHKYCDIFVVRFFLSEDSFIKMRILGDSGKVWVRQLFYVDKKKGVDQDFTRFLNL